jgi:hypothetical protein
MTPNRTQMIRAYILSAAVVLVAALGSLLVMETATVKLSVPPQKLVANITLSGGQTSGDLRTQHIAATVTEAQDGTASTVQVGPTNATGQVLFSCTSAQCASPLTVPAGTIVTTSKSLGYSTQAAATVTRTQPATVAVRATASGTAWNTARDTITVINDSPNPDLHVNNPAAIAGGTDAHPAPVIQQSDFDSVRTSLAAKVTDALGVALTAKAFQMTYVADGPPVLTVISNHKVGEQVSSFTMTMTGTIGAIAFSDTEARALMRSALEAKIPQGQQLTSDPIQFTWQVQRSSPNGELTVTGTATGFVTPKLSTNTLRARIRGLSPADATKSLQRAVPGSKVEIRISPVAVPWLPLIAEHITMTVVGAPVRP